MSRYSEAEAVYGHPLQYAVVEGLDYPRGHIVLETEDLDKDAVLHKLRMDDDPLGAVDPSYKLSMRAMHMLDHLHAYGSQIRVERYNRCPTDEQWSPCDVRKKAL
jgi:hypothetical protein